MKNIFAIATAAIAISAAPALAQTAGTSGTADTAKTPHAKSSGSLNASDHAFVKEAAIGGMAEVELGKLAKEKASSDEVKKFGDRMVTDHSKANDELKQVAQRINVQLPTALDAKQQATVDRLSKLSGDAFDKAYMKTMVEDHKQDVAAFKKASTSGANEDVKQFASTTLPTLEEHLKQAEDTASKVGVSTTGTSGHASKKSKKGSGQ